MDTEKIRKYKSIIGFLAFILIIAFLFSKITWLFRGNGSEVREYIAGFDTVNSDIDVVLFDGSDVTRFYDPLEAWNKYGYTSYNYATPTAHADMLRFYAEESRRSHKAKLYVFDLRTISFVTDEVSEPALRNWSDSIPVFSWVRTKGIFSYLFNRDLKGVDIPSYFFDIIYYHTLYYSLASKYQWSYMDLNNIRNINKGFRPYLDHFSFDKPVCSEERGALSEKQSNALKKLVDYCDREKLNAVFICSPIVISDNDQKLMNSVSDYIEERGYEFIDFNKYYDEMGLDFSTDYVDVNHVNYFGAKKFTACLSDMLVEKYDLPDHRKDAAFDSWNKEYELTESKRSGWMESVQNELDRHLEAREIGERLHTVEDFSEWYSYIRNRNYTVLVKMTEIPKEMTAEDDFNKMMKDYCIDPSEDAYIGAWNGPQALYFSSVNPEKELSIGVDAGYGQDVCKISLETDTIRIGDVDYAVNGSPVQVVVYDNNYRQVVDNASIRFDPDGVKVWHSPL